MPAKNQAEDAQQTWPCWRLHLGLCGLQTVRNTFLLLMSQPARGVLSQQLEWMRQTPRPCQLGSVGFSVPWGWRWALGTKDAYCGPELLWDF